MTTVGHCVIGGAVSTAGIEAALSAFLADADPLRVAPGIFAVLPEFERLPVRLRRSMIEIALLARV